MITTVLFFVLATALTILAVYRTNRTTRVICTSKNARPKLTPWEIVWLILRWLAIIIGTVGLMGIIIVLYKSETPDRDTVFFAFLVLSFYPPTLIVEVFYVLSLILSLTGKIRGDRWALRGHVVGAWLLFVIFMLCLLGDGDCNTTIMRAHYRQYGGAMHALVNDVKQQIPDSVDISITFDWRGNPYNIILSKADNNEIFYQKGTHNEGKTIGKLPLYLTPDHLKALQKRLKAIGCRSIETGCSGYRYTRLLFRNTGYAAFYYRFYDHPLNSKEIKKLNTDSDIILYNRHVVFEKINEGFGI